MSVDAPDGTGSLLERDESASALAALLASVRSTSEGRLALVAGEAGVGKTSLLRRFCAAQDQQVRILWGACDPLFTPCPLGPLLSVAEQAGGEFAERVAAAARPHELVAALLRELRGRTATVLVLEDVHWADEATLDFLVLLAARIGSASALVVASYRDDELDRVRPLRIVLGELGRRPKRVKLQPLSRAGVASLAEPHGVEADELYRRTGGNPFFVKEVLAAGSELIPETVRDAVLARATRLSGPARRLLEAVAVVPGQVDLWLLDVLGGDQADRVDECLTSGILSAGRAHVGFRHELARLAIEEATSPSRRLALHRMALAALSARDADFARLAHHADAAADVDAVLYWAPRAAERAALAGAHREAAAQYTRALRFADGLPPETRAELLQHQADECYTTAQFETAIAAQRAALECHQLVGDRLGEGNALRSLSRLLFFAGRIDEAEPLALEAVELLERLPAGHELAMAYGNVSQRRMVVEDADGAAQWGQRALDLARHLHDTEAHIYALTNTGAAEFQSGADAGRSKLESALALAQQHDLEEYAGRAFLQLVLCAYRARRFELASRYLEPGLGYCSERGLDTWRLYLLACRARLELGLGRWEEAAAAAAVVLGDSRSPPVASGWVLAVLGLVRARRGDAEASAPLEQAHVLVRSTGELERIAQVAAARAEAAWLTGEGAAVERVTDVALELALGRRAPWDVGELAYWRWQVGVGDVLAAGAAAEPYSLSMAGDWARAASVWREIGCPYEAALALGHSDDQLVVREAIDQLQQLGARPAAAIVARRLRERGVRGVPRGPRPQTRENPAGLTTRELEVLGLVAAGCRNAQIAERLVISEKTVDHHVSAILRKLDVHSRGAAAAEALRLGLTAHDAPSVRRG